MEIKNLIISICAIFQKRTEDYNLYYKGDCKTLNEILIKEGIINGS